MQSATYRQKRSYGKPESEHTDPLIKLPVSGFKAMQYEDESL